MRIRLLGCAGLALLGTLEVHAQTTLPPIVVTAPSPIRSAPPASPAETSPAVVPVEITITPLAPVLGALPIVTDQFATVTVIPNEELRRTPAATLGDLLFAKPGITGSSFAPGAASRPVIRGLDVNRVGIAENGIGAGGVSDLGEDHFVPVMPLATGQVEVIRGPATLRYGSQSIGGVVSATNNRIPERLPCAAPCVTGEMRGAATTVDNGLEGGVLIDAAAGNVAVHVDAFGRKADDYRVPSYPYLFVPGLPFNGRQPNSAARADTQSAGASYVFNEGFVGLAVTQSNALYGIPGIDGAAHSTRIDARETKVTSKGEYRPQADGIVRDLVRRDRLQAQRAWVRRPGRRLQRRRAPDLHQQGAGRPCRGAVAPVQPALRHIERPRSGCRPGSRS